MHVKPTSREISLAHNLSRSYQIVWKFCIEHDSDAAVPCVKNQHDWTDKIGVMDEWDFARFEFKMRFGRVWYISGPPGPKYMRDVYLIG